MAATLHFNAHIFSSVYKKKQYAGAALIACIVTAACSLFRSCLTPESIAFITLGGLLAIALVFNILPVAATMVSGVLIPAVFFIITRFTFNVNSPEKKILLLLCFVTIISAAGFINKAKQVKKANLQKDEKAQSLKLYNTLLNSLSHELKTPVAVITAAADNLLGNNPGLTADDKQTLLKEISNASLRLNRQVENLLNMSRLESGFLQPKKNWCDIQELVYNVVQSLDGPLAGHATVVDIPAPLPLYKIDYGLTQLVLHNLILNAAVHTPAGSAITVRGLAKHGKLVIMVEDNGNGFAETDIKNIFDKFYRVEGTVSGGTGLGLFIVKGFTEVLNGTVDVKNSATGGAVFTIEITAEHWS